MTKKDLKTGDIVVQRNGFFAVVIRSEKDDYLLFPDSGYDWLEDYNDDMTYMYSDDGSGCDDIMQVYRAETGAIGFLDFEDENPIYERDYTWVRPTKEETEKSKIGAEAKHNTEQAKAQLLNKNTKLLKTLAMGYYGNRTLVNCTDDQVDEVITGATKEVRQMLNIVPNRNFIALPGTECFVVYDMNREVTEHSKVVCYIPEQNIKVYDKCIFCRKDGDKIKGILPEDIRKIDKYIVD